MYIVLTSELHIYCCSIYFTYVNFLIVPSGPPLNFNTKLTSDTSVILTWDPPAEQHRNGEITGYEIKYKQTNASNEQNKITDTEEQNLQLDALVTGLRYHFSVAAMTINGTGSFANKAILIEECESTFMTLYLIQNAFPYVMQLILMILG